MGNIIIGVLGATGRMGQAITAEIANTENCSSIGASQNQDLNLFFEKCDIVVDFTNPQPLENHLKIAEARKTPIVIGTTGLSDKQISAISNSSANIPIIYASNTSLGVNILIAAMKKAAGLLGDDFKVEIVDKHHQHKIDAPSGTALSFAKAIQVGRDIPSEDIKYSITREGEIAGEHTVTFKNQSEEISFTHKAFDRKLFAKGALQAALWLVGKPNGLYSMNDVLGL
jgi:4-hydroxy-tetrahydrodipicolinate reductase